VSGGAGLTFDAGFEVGVPVELVDLPPPVEVVSPVGDHLLQGPGVEAIVKLAVLQGGDGARLVHPPVQVLMKRMTRRRE